MTTDEQMRAVIRVLYHAMQLLLAHPTCNVTIHQHASVPKKVTMEKQEPLVDDEVTLAQQRLLTTILSQRTL